MDDYLGEFEGVPGFFFGGHSGEVLGWGDPQGPPGKFGEGDCGSLPLILSPSPPRSRQLSTRSSQDSSSVVPPQILGCLLPKFWGLPPSFGRFWRQGHPQSWGGSAFPLHIPNKNIFHHFQTLSLVFWGSRDFWEGVFSCSGTHPKIAALRRHRPFKCTPCFHGNVRCFTSLYVATVALSPPLPRFAAAARPSLPALQDGGVRGERGRRQHPPPSSFPRRPAASPPPPGEPPGTGDAVPPGLEPRGRCGRRGWRREGSGALRGAGVGARRGRRGRVTALGTLRGPPGPNSTRPCPGTPKSGRVSGPSSPSRDPQCHPVVPNF